MTPAAVPGQQVPGQTAAARAGRGVPALAPGRDEAIDAIALLALTVIGIVGFRVAYGGHAYLAAGAAGAVLGVVLSHVCQRARVPLLAVVAVAIFLFLLSGGLISQAGTLSPPTLATLRAVASAVVQGWQQLLTTARPVGSSAGLLVLPYAAGLFSGVAGYSLARLTSRVLLPAAAPAIVVALSILFGAGQPTAAVLQGAGFAGVCLAWAAVRQYRGTSPLTTIGRQRPWARIGAATAVLAVAGAGATVVGPWLPGAHAHPRVVLHVAPPFDVTIYSSPLAGFRDFTQDVPPSVSVWDKELFSTTGLPAGGRVRIAAMDTYDGLSWGVANAAASASTFAGFQRIGSLLPGSVAGPVRTATIAIDSAYALPWLPDLAGTTGFAFTGPGGAGAQAALRFNVATTTGIVPGGLPAGLRYTVRAAGVPGPAAAQLASATPYGAPGQTIVIPAAVQAFAQAHSDTANSPMAKVLALAAYLKGHGRYTNGGGGQSDVTAGHGAGRLTSFLEARQIVGDDEQYAATMALLANAVGVPARVSLDATVEANGSVYGRDVRADVELELAGYGWVTLPASAFTSAVRPTLQQRTVIPPAAPVKVVPPRRNGAAPVAAANQSSAVSRSTQAPAGQGFAIPAIVVILLRYAGIPLCAVAAIAAALIMAKALRRRRRRGAGPPAARVAGAWRELLDLGRDLGLEPAAHATRREQASHAERGGLVNAVPAAVAADAAVFGPADPDDATAAGVWALIDQARHASTAKLTRRRRTWVAVNPASLWASRATLTRPRPPVRPSGPARNRASSPGTGSGRGTGTGKPGASAGIGKAGAATGTGNAAADPPVPLPHRRPAQPGGADR